MMNKPGRSGASRILDAYKYSLKGLRAAWECEEAFRQESMLAMVMLPMAFWLGTNATERMLLIITVMIVIITELINSALEAVVDRISTEHHKLSGQAKDIGSAAVMLSMLLCLLCWTMIAWQRFL
jgi:diacylglycerol kinase (ATP)